MCDGIRISIHALREEGDLWSLPSSSACQISIHALREEGDKGVRAFVSVESISIHALREEGDVAAPVIAKPANDDFYPRPPRGGRPPGL